MVSRASEGIYFERQESGEWLETSHWPAGRSRARIKVDTQSPFGDYSVDEARSVVLVFVAQETVRNHGYRLFAIIPIQSEPMSPETKARLKRWKEGD